jgi:CTP synthase
LTKESNLSTGKIYQSVIERERIGEYLGKTVQVVPHVSDAIQEWILRVAKQPVKSMSENNDNGGDSPPEVCIVELGGTLGDIESMPFVEALRQLQENLGYKNMCFAHVSLVPTMGSPPEQKTKPTQHSVKQMMSMGLRPDFLCCRGSSPLEPGTVSKLSMFTSVPNGAVLSLHDVSNIYRVPLMMIEQNLHAMLLQRLRMGPFQKGVNYSNAVKVDIGESSVIRDWQKLADSVDEPESECVIAIVGKYIDQGDACEYQPVVGYVWSLSSIAPCA